MARYAMCSILAICAACLSVAAQMPTLPIPETYTRPLITDQGNEVWGVYIRADEPETPHRHSGGVLFAKPQPILVNYLNGEQYFSDRVGDCLEDIPLPQADWHYGTAPLGYQAVFIELKTRAETQAASLQWLQKPDHLKKSSSGSGCIAMTIGKNEATFQTGNSEAFLVADSAIRLIVMIDGRFEAIAPLPNLPHYVYYLPSNLRYRLFADTKTEAFLLEQ